MLESNKLKEMIDSMIAHVGKIEKNLLELSIYSNGSITLQDLYNLPLAKLEPLQQIMKTKIEMDLGVNSKKYL